MHTTVTSSVARRRCSTGPSEADPPRVKARSRVCHMMDERLPRLVSVPAEPDPFEPDPAEPECFEPEPADKRSASMPPPPPPPPLSCPDAADG